MNTLMKFFMFIFLVGCNAPKPILSENNSLEIPIILTENDTVDNEKETFNIIQDRLYKNSLFNRCEKNIEINKESCVQFDIINLKNFHFVTVTYRNRNRNKTSIQVKLSISIISNNNRSKYAVVKKYNGDNNYLQLFKNDNIEEIDMKDMKDEIDLRKKFETENNITYKELELIQMDIANIHNTSTPFRFLRVQND